MFVCVCVTESDCTYCCASEAGPGWECATTTMGTDCIRYRIASKSASENTLQTESSQATHSLLARGKERKGERHREREEKREL